MEDNKNQKWTVKKPDGTIYGPADSETIKRWIQEKRVLPEDYLSPEGWERWQTAKSLSQFADLFQVETATAEPVSTSASTRKIFSWKLELGIGVAICLLILVGVYFFINLTKRASILTKSTKPKSKVTKKIIKVQKPENINIKFDIALEKLPSNYKGDDIKKLYKKLNISPKSEFETTREYQKRLKSVAGNNIYAFSKRDRYLKYNADTQTFKFDISFREKILSYEVPMGKYLGSNAFGATAQIEKVWSYEYYIDFKNEELKTRLNKERDRYGDYNYVLRVRHIAPQKAKKLKDNLTILYVCRLTKTPPFTESSNWRSEPTINYPRDRKSITNSIFVKLLEIWIYDIKSGKIFLKKKVYTEDQTKKIKDDDYDKKIAECYKRENAILSSNYPRTTQGIKERRRLLTEIRTEINALLKKKEKKDKEKKGW